MNLDLTDYRRQGNMMPLRKTDCLLFFVAFLGCLTPLVQSAPATQSAPFAGEIAAFQKADARRMPPKDANLFVGSSSIRFWTTLADDFPGIPVINRGFGGSMLPDCVRYADRIVIPYHARRIFVYGGDNDLAAGHTPEQVLADFKAFVRTVRAAQPKVPIYFLAIKPSPARVKLLGRMREANKLVKTYAQGAADVHFIDVFTPMLGSDGQPRAGLFRADKLHMNKEGYALWTRLIMPLLK